MYNLDQQYGRKKIRYNQFPQLSYGPTLIASGHIATLVPAVTKKLFSLFQDGRRTDLYDVLGDNHPKRVSDLGALTFVTFGLPGSGTVIIWLRIRILPVLKKNCDTKLIIQCSTYVFTSEIYLPLNLCELFTSNMRL